MGKLIVNNYFKNFRNYKDYRHWPIVVRIRFSALFKSEVTLALFQSFGYIPVRIDFENIEVREGATILAAIFSSLLGIIARLLRARRTRGTEFDTHRLWSTSFRLVVTVNDRAYVRTYASTDCTGGVGETIKRKGGVSQACLGKSTSFTLDIHNMGN